MFLLSFFCSSIDEEARDKYGQVYPGDKEFLMQLMYVRR